MFNSRVFRAYVIPVSVFLSVSIAGGYGTGREVVEFFTRHGTYEGIYGLIFAGVCVAVLSAFTFEIARQVKAYDYRTFMKELIGPFWILFEILYLFTLLLVLAVVGSAAGAMIAEHTGIPQEIGLLAILGTIALLVFYGRELIERVMVFLTLFLFSAFTLYFLSVLSNNWEQILHQLEFPSSPSEFTWILSASKFTLYSAPAAVFILFSTHGISTRREALISGGLCGLFYVVPGLLFHISFLGELPEIGTQQVPVHWMITMLGNDTLLIVYLLAMLGTFLGTGSGFIQAVNERLDAWSVEKLGKVLSPATHSGVAIGGLLISALLGQLGIITLIAKGYGTMAWGFLIVFVVPVTIVGTRRIFFDRPES
jgi:uncharacterized membrane protein YkvI